MKIFKVVSVVAILVIAFSSMAIAQPSRPKAPDVEQLLTDMKKRLNLTEEQVEQLRPIMEDNTKKRQELFEKYRGQGKDGMKSLKTEMENLEKEVETQFEKILTEEQMKEYQTMQEELRKNMRQRMQKRRQG